MNDITNQFNASTLNNPVFNYGDKMIGKYLGVMPVIPEVCIGRDGDIRALHDRLFDGNNILLLVNGEGGIGKTTLAAKYFQRYFHEYSHLAWVFAEKSLRDALLTLAGPLKITFDQTLSEEERLQKMLLEMAGLKKPCLLVIDNANDLPELTAHYHELRKCPNFHILLTTRIMEFSHAGTYRVGHLDEPKAMELFSTYYPGHNAAEDELLKGIVRAIGYNTLVIELLAKSLKSVNRFRTGYSLEQMLGDLQHSGLFGLSRSEKVPTGYNPGKFTFRDEKPETVIEAMYDLARLEREEEQLLCVFSVLPAEPVAFATLEELQPRNKELERGLKSLVQKGWIEYDSATNHFKCSPVVQAVSRRQVGERLYEQCELLVDTLVEKLEYDTGGHLQNTDYKRASLYVRYAENIIGFIENTQYAKSFLLDRVGNFHNTIGNLEKALSYYEEQSRLGKELYESNPQNVSFKNGLAISYSKLGETHTSLGNLEKALSYYEKDKQLSEELYESNPQNVIFKNGLAISYEKLGSTHTSLGNLEKALSYYDDETRLFEELYEANPQNVSFKNGLAISYSKLGETHTSLGNLEKALSYYEERSRLGKELYESNPQNVSFKNGLAISYSKLGETHTSLGNLEKALSYYEKDKQLSEELYESNSQNVSFKNGLAISYAKLGIFSRDHQNDKEKARVWFEQAEALWAELVKSFPAYAEFHKNMRNIKNVLKAL